MKLTYRSLNKALLLSVLVVCWLPVQQVAYIWPLLLLPVILFVLLRSASSVRLGLYAIAVYLFVGFLGLMTGAFYEVGALHSAMWALTHGSLLFIAVLYVHAHSFDERTFLFFVKYYLLVGALEAVLGTIQFFLTAGFSESIDAGDNVIGTLGSNSHLLAMNMMVLMFLSFFMWRQSGQIYYMILMAIFLQVWLLASAMHTLLVFQVTLVIFYLLTTANFKTAFRNVSILGAAGVVVWASVLFVQEDNANYLLSKAGLVNTASPYVEYYGKVELYKRSLITMPLQEGGMAALFGVGAGAYSSRASWMLSGNYLGNQSIVPVSPSPMWDKYLSDIWSVGLADTPYWVDGVANQPFSSWMTILGEFGYVGLVFALIFSITVIKKMRRYLRFEEVSVWQIHFGLLLFLFLLVSMMFDNWVEYPRFMLPSSLLVLLSFSVGKNIVEEKKAIGVGQNSQ